jgi:hypothetical protein
MEPDLRRDVQPVKLWRSHLATAATHGWRSVLAHEVSAHREYCFKSRKLQRSEFLVNP